MQLPISTLKALNAAVPFLLFGSLTHAAPNSTPTPTTAPSVQPRNPPDGAWSIHHWWDHLRFLTDNDATETPNPQFDPAGPKPSLVPSASAYTPGPYTQHPPALAERELRGPLAQSSTFTPAPWSTFLTLLPGYHPPDPTYYVGPTSEKYVRIEWWPGKEEPSSKQPFDPCDFTPSMSMLPPSLRVATATGKDYSEAAKEFSKEESCRARSFSSAWPGLLPTGEGQRAVGPVTAVAETTTTVATTTGLETPSPLRAREPMDTDHPPVEYWTLSAQTSVPQIDHCNVIFSAAKWPSASIRMESEKEAFMRSSCEARSALYSSSDEGMWRAKMSSWDREGREEKRAVPATAAADATTTIATTTPTSDPPHWPSPEWESWHYSHTSVPQIHHCNIILSAARFPSASIKMDPEKEAFMRSSCHPGPTRYSWDESMWRYVMSHPDRWARSSAARVAAVAERTTMVTVATATAA